MSKPFDLAWRVLKNEITQGSPTGLPENFHMDNILPHDDYETLDYFHNAVTSLSDLPSDYNRVYDGRTGKEMDLKYGHHILENFESGDYYGDYGHDFFIHRDPITSKNHFIRAEDLQEHIEPHQMLSGERINEMLTTDEWSMDDYGPSHYHPEEILYESLKRYFPQGYNPQ